MEETSMKRFTACACVMALAALACEKPGTDGVAEARDALPTADTLSIQVPAAQGSARAEKVGDVSLAYLLTRTVATTLNGGAAFILILVKTVMDLPVTSVSGDTYTWGPWTEALKPGEYKLTVRLTNDGDYAWALEGRKKGTQ